MTQRRVLFQLVESLGDAVELDAVCVEGEACTVVRYGRATSAWQLTHMLASRGTAFYLDMKPKS